jgi:hypothetical protein
LPQLLPHHFSFLSALFFFILLFHLSPSFLVFLSSASEQERESESFEARVRGGFNAGSGLGGMRAAAGLFNGDGQRSLAGGWVALVAASARVMRRLGFDGGKRGSSN